MKADEMSRRLGTFFDGLDHHGGAGHDVRDLVRMSGGASRETFSFELVRTDPPGRSRQLVLQRVRTGSLSASFPMEGEARLLTAAGEAGVPVAEVVAASDDPDIIGAPFLVMARVDGETIARRILRDDEFAVARGRVVSQCAVALARIHALAVGVAPHLRADDPVQQLRGLLDMLGEPHPAFELALRWLDSHRRPPSSTRTTIVHGDFRLGNLIVDDDGLVAVLDWELAHIGDPMEDLGWFCVRAWRFGSPLPVAGLGSYEELFAAYSEASGTPVEADVVRWWEVLGTLRWGVICILQASGHLSGVSRSVELAAIGRRTVENEYDVLRLIGADAGSGPGGSSGSGGSGGSGDRAGSPRGYDSGPHDAPTAPQLVEAVREFLEADVLAATSGRVQFHTRVAIRVLAMVERELADGGAMADTHRERLGALGFADDAALAAAMRSGALDDRADEVLATVYATVLDKLAIANPTYEDNPPSTPTSKSR